eukprot:CAMPEP_0174715486 /NCGR_PEP_ID=MMETSP1094-20130205/21245_1 /TAXON_ID=156173 /ORGANISM="Chrysochromulina brevifilum, Strain UTEX LB 985" /LENGTH=430 /DNA_ID=CAMNT_0015915061 /DNA_START=13 /DNA_END=1305 /DNA_ORIENTATION=+
MAEGGSCSVTSVPLCEDTAPTVAADSASGACACSDSGTQQLDKRKMPLPLPPHKRQAEEAQLQAAPTGSRGSPNDHETFSAFQQLTSVQRAIIRRFIGMLNTEEDSVVITNPLQQHGPIVYVTNAWQDMCGYSNERAIGQNPRLTQGEGSCPETIHSMGRALSKGHACRVRLINYRGYNNEPFWNCLSVQPILFNRKPVLFAATLKDYSYRLTRLVSLAPAQFCKAGDCLQYRVHLCDIGGARSLSQARQIDVTASHLDIEDLTEVEQAEVEQAGGGESDEESSSTGKQAPPQLLSKHVKRLGFGGLELEPEYLLDRLRHECAELGMPCQFQELEVGGTELMRMEVCSEASSSSGSENQSSADGDYGDYGGHSSLRAVLHVLPEDAEGTYAISLMRLVGDTFQFHAMYRKLRDRLSDIVSTPPLRPMKGK